MSTISDVRKFKSIASERSSDVTINLHMNFAFHSFLHFQGKFLMDNFSYIIIVLIWKV